VRWFNQRENMMGSTKGSRLGACAVGMTLVMGWAACAESADLDLVPLLERAYHEVYAPGRPG